MPYRRRELFDGRAYTANVAGPAALLVAKLHKLGERQATPGRLIDKDAHDLYRLLVATPTENLAAGCDGSATTNSPVLPPSRSSSTVSSTKPSRRRWPGSDGSGRRLAGKG
ncbi:MAG: hypothetical protein L0K86_26260 [Actinomycetia bacterium]|nr:hypothetical protein [Actinomycetes bacterium]